MDDEKAGKIRYSEFKEAVADTVINHLEKFQRIWFDIPILRHPSWFSIQNAKPEEVAELKKVLEFMEKNGDNEKIYLLIDDKKSGVHLEQQLEIGEAFVFIGVNDDLKPYVQALDKTVFSVRDTITGSKYLVVGAEWGTTFVGKFNPKLKVVDYLDTKFQFGELKTFIISYEINQIQNKLWIVDNIPLPVKAEYFTIDGKPDFSYELIDVRSVPLS